MNLRSLLTAVLIIVFFRVAAMPAFDADKFCRELDDRGAERIEGIWQFTTDGATVAIRSTGTGTRQYEIILISAPARSLRSGSKLGSVTATAVDGSYEARMYTRFQGSKLYSPAKFTLKLDETESMLAFHKHKSSIIINLWQFVPYLWRNTVRYREPTKKAAPGAVRIYPEPSRPIEPRYL